METGPLAQLGAGLGRLHDPTPHVPWEPALKPIPISSAPQPSSVEELRKRRPDEPRRLSVGVKPSADLSSLPGLRRRNGHGPSGRLHDNLSAHPLGACL